MNESIENFEQNVVGQHNDTIRRKLAGCVINDVTRVTRRVSRDLSFWVASLVNWNFYF